MPLLTSYGDLIKPIHFPLSSDAGCGQPRMSVGGAFEMAANYVATTAKKIEQFVPTIFSNYRGKHLHQRTNACSR